MNFNFAWETIWTHFRVHREEETVLGAWETAIVDFVIAVVITVTNQEPFTRLKTAPIVLPVFQGLWEERNKGLNVKRNGMLTFLVNS